MSDAMNAPVGTPVIPRYFHQLGILVLDGSGSMHDKSSTGSPKAKEVSAGCLELFNRLNVSRVKQNFSFACVKFDVSASTVLPVTAFDYNTLMNTDFDPTKGKGTGTHIFDGLKEAQKLSEQFLNSAPPDGVPHKVLILVMSDGMCFEPGTSQKIADALKVNPKIQIACAYFGQVGTIDPEAQQLLKYISSDSSTFYTTVYDGQALRSFFERSISQSAGITQNKDGLIA